MGLNVAQKLIKSHLLSGEMTAGTEIGIRIDQTLTQDATGTLVMLELKSMGLDSARTELELEIAGSELTNPETAEIFSRVLGRPVKFQQLPMPIVRLVLGKEFY